MMTVHHPDDAENHVGVTSVPLRACSAVQLEEQALEQFLGNSERFAFLQHSLRVGPSTEL